MKTTDSFQNEIGIERKLAKNIVDKIMRLDPITIEWIKSLMKQWHDAIHFKTKMEICKDIFQTFIDNGIIDESSAITGVSSIECIEGHAVWFPDIIRLLEKNN